MLLFAFLYFAFDGIYATLRFYHLRERTLFIEKRTCEVMLFPEAMRVLVSPEFLAEAALCAAACFYFEGFGAPESSATASINGFIADENFSYKVPVTFDSQFDLPAITKKGYSFLGWYNGETKMESGIWNIASDVVLTPRWQAGGNTV
jgi:hypothetical protein